MSAKLFLGGVSPNTTTEVIQDHFSKYGAIADACVMYKDGRHRGFGFVTFETFEAMNDALAEEQVIDSRTIDVKQAVPQSEAPQGPGGRPNGKGDFGGRGGKGGRGPSRSDAPSDKVFIGGLSQNTTDDQVRDHFSQYGTLVDCVVMKDKDSGRSRGFGFVQYDSTEPVDQVMMDYSKHNIDGKWVEVKRAVPQDKSGGGGRRGGRDDGGDHYGKGAAYPPPSYGYGGKGGAYGGGYSPYGYGAPPAYSYPPPAGYGYYPPPGYSPYGYPPAYGEPGDRDRDREDDRGAYGASRAGAGSYGRARPY